MIYIIYIQRFTSVLLKKIDLIYINVYNLHLYLLIHILYVLYSASIRHAGITAIEKQFYYYYYYYYKERRAKQPTEAYRVATRQGKEETGEPAGDV